MAYRKPISPPEPGCSDVLECALADPDPFALVMLAVAAGVVLLAVTVALAHIAGARSLLEEERQRIADEAEAFGAFARRVADVDVARTPATDGGPRGPGIPGGPTKTAAMRTPGTNEGLDAVRDAYRETVMGVPHYEAEYDESLATNMSLEFGEDVASAIEGGAMLTPQLKETLVERSRTARRQRMELLRQLGSEAEALDDAEKTLRRCRKSADRIEDASLEERTFDDLVAEWRLLEDRQETAEAVLTERQEHVQERDRKTGTRPGGPSFEEYLYERHEVTYPVLAEGSSLVDRLERAKNKVERALATHT